MAIELTEDDKSLLKEMVEDVGFHGILSALSGMAVEMGYGEDMRDELHELADNIDED